MLSTYVSYQAINRDLTQSLANTAKEPVVSTATNYYLANIGKVTTADDFVNNDRLFNYAMKAFGMEDLTYAKGLMKKVLEGGVSDPDALANKLSDPRYKAFAQAFNFAADGPATTSLSSATSGTVSKYVQQTLEDDAGNQNQGVKLALYFERVAPTVTSTYGILADKALLTVVQTALGISPLTSAADIDTQARYLTGKLNLSDFQDPAKLQQFIGRFSALYDMNNQSSSSPASLTSILFSSSPNTGISGDLLMSLQNLKLGGI